MKDRIIGGLTVLVLLIVGGRLTWLVRGEWRRLAHAHSLALSIPKKGSLHGIGSNGLLVSAGPGSRFRLLFVVHVANLSRDVEYWNATRHTLGSKGSDIEWWGICDAGASCGPFQHLSQFSIIGFMDPYQMRVMANADVDARALLYEESVLRGAVERTSEPAAAAEAIARLRQYGS